MTLTIPNSGCPTSKSYPPSKSATFPYPAIESSYSKKRKKIFLQESSMNTNLKIVIYKKL